MDKISYCPRCGNVRSRHFEYCDCIKDVSFFDRKEWKKAKFIETDHEIKDESYNLNEPHYLDAITEDDCLFFWETYVDIPENDKLNREAHEARKEEMLSFFHKGGITAKIKADMLAAKDPIRCPKCGSPSVSAQSKFNTGRAVAGTAIAGAAGAVIGGKSGNKVINVCQNCGHKWEPGNR